MIVSIVFVFNVSGQINESPIIGNPIIEKAFQQKMADLGIVPSPSNSLQRMGVCPIIIEDATYLFPTESVVFDLDTINGVRYELISASDNFGSTSFSADSMVYNAENITGAGLDIIFLKRTVIGDTSSIELEYEIYVRRAGETLIMTPEILTLEERGAYCVSPINNLPGDILCNELILTAENYGGQGLQNVYFRSRNEDEHCFIYHATRFSGNDTIGIVLCDEFSVCDTFLQPILIVGDTVNLPFFDDFTNGGPFPAKSKWLEDLTYVNNNMPVSPPSFGVATFDGLNQKGQPYGGGYGVADRLTSKPIDLSNSSVGQNVVMSFYYQLKGQGFLPRVQDSLLVEFLTEADGWKKVAAFKGSGFIALDSFPPFIFHGIELDDPAYFHDGFQFRFSNLSERTGAYGVWHIDYIVLDEGRTVNSQNLDDVAIIEGNSSILENYQSMPILQFQGFESKELSNSINAAFFNHLNLTENLENSTVTISENITGTTWPSFEMTGGIESNLDSRVPEFRSVTVPGTIYSTIENDLSAFSINEQKLEIEVMQTLKVAAQTGIGVFANDTLSKSTHISNYYAYDDGTAERALDSDGLNSIVAVEYEANKDDQLEAVQFHFPQVNGDYTNQRFNLLVWQGALGEVSDAIYSRVVKPSSPDSLQSFTTYLIADPNLLDTISSLPIDIPAGKFYVGWQQLESTPNPIPVGYDKNNPEASQFISFWTGALWRKHDDFINFKGALMIRPVMSGGQPLQTSTKESLIENSKVIAYPNPATDLLNFKIENQNLKDLKINIYNNLGQSFYSGKLTQQIDIQRFTAGIYFAKIVNQKTFETQFIQFVKQ